MIALIQLIAASVAVGLLLSLSATVWWQVTRQVMIATNIVALYGAYAFVLGANSFDSSGVGVATALLTSVFFTIVFALLGQALQPREFLLAAIAVAEVGLRMAYHLRDLTGGPNGISTAVSPPLSGCGFMALGGSGAVVLLAGRYWAGLPDVLQRRMAAVSPPLTVRFGISKWSQQIGAAWIGCTLAAMAGALFAAIFGFVHPDDFALSLGVSALAVALVTKRSIMWPVLLLGSLLFGLRGVLDPLSPVGSPRGFAALELIVASTVLGAAFLARDKTP